jgi:hypothetical protein
MVEVNGIEPMTSCVQGRRSPSWATPPISVDSYQKKLLTENWTLILVGLDRFELSTSRLSGVRSNQAELQAPNSSQPIIIYKRSHLISQNQIVTKSRVISFFKNCFLRKEVIQPLVPQRLPCYDFTPIISHTLGACLHAKGAVSPTTSGTTNSHGVTGGVYKARERIHRGMLIRDY